MAWDDISGKIVTGTQYGIQWPWYPEKNVFIAICSDGLRPVIFKVERI